MPIENLEPAPENPGALHPLLPSSAPSLYPTLHVQDDITIISNNI